MKIFKEFKEFAMRGNVVDMAVGVVIGSAFGKIVTSLVGDIIMPPIGKLMGGVNFSDLFFTLNWGKPLLNGAPITSLAQAQQAGLAVIAYGQFLNCVLDFVIVAACMFLIMKAMNSLTKNESAPTTKECRFCLSTIPRLASRCPHCTSELA